MQKDNCPRPHILDVTEAVVLHAEARGRGGGGRVRRQGIVSAGGTCCTCHAILTDAKVCRVTPLQFCCILLIQGVIEGLMHAAKASPSFENLPESCALIEPCH